MKKTLFSILLFCLGTMISCSEPTDDLTAGKTDPNEKPKPEIPSYIGEISSTIVPLEFTQNMGVGWNTTNTLDANAGSGLGAETSWGNPKVTEALIDSVAARGFKTLRVPVSWGQHIGEAPGYVIDPMWMSRVEQVVKWGLENDMYVIINIHHDDDRVVPTKEKIAESKVFVSAIWKQIAIRFKRYNEKLIFETLNEPRVVGHPLEWQGGDMDGRKHINELHKTAVNTIRQTGGNNIYRMLMIAPYVASFNAIDGFELPNDKRLIVSLHSYSPYWFCLSDFDVQYEFTDNHINELKGEFDRYYDKFISKGIPIVIGEWGAKQRDLPDGSGNNHDHCVRHAEVFAKEAKLRGIIPVVWDFGYIDRYTYKWTRAEEIAKIIDAADIKMDKK